jgi:hypothetical protein
MNEIVRKHYPASRLPADLRKDIPEGAEVDLTITVHDGSKKKIDISKLVGTGRNVHGTPDEVIAHIRELREDR